MKLRCLLFFCFLVASVANAFSVDREAFTFTNYDLNVRVDPAQQRLGVRGKITLRNDSATLQKIAVLQISSSLDWRSITSDGKPLQFVMQPYTSDIDHTGKLSEAIVTLPTAVPPHSSIDLQIGYEGVIVLDATRLTRIDAPEAQAKGSDWDQISANFTAVRGAGYVTWYPISTPDASLADNSLFEVLGAWKLREGNSKMSLQMQIQKDEGQAPELLVNATACPTSREEAHQFVAECTYRSLGAVVPAFVIADYETVDRPAVAVHFLHGHDASATGYADAADKVLPFITEWFGAAKSKAQTADLLDVDATPFESGPLLLTSLSSMDSKLAGLVAAHQLTHAAFSLATSVDRRRSGALRASALSRAREKSPGRARLHGTASIGIPRNGKFRTEARRRNSRLPGKHRERRTLPQQSNVRVVDAARHDRRRCAQESHIRLQTRAG
jgi:hypothetical protein